MGCGKSFAIFCFFEFLQILAQKLIVFSWKGYHNTIDIIVSKNCHQVPRFRTPSTATLREIRRLHNLFQCSDFEVVADCAAAFELVRHDEGEQRGCKQGDGFQISLQRVLEYERYTLV